MAASVLLDRPATLKTSTQVLAPDRWEGQTGCHVGPFRDLRAAESFANALVDFGRYETLREQVVVNDDGVFVEVRRVLA
ncbi:MAG TPA: hypothetical protein VKB31_05580 [Trueperaceae bacterium]|nr:hypothetical protein [Trueperaceae bacterium]